MDPLPVPPEYRYTNWVASVGLAPPTWNFFSSAFMSKLINTNKPLQITFDQFWLP
ncbi:hypothetical protein DPMN_001885 [Dreissena polymorpha]|uniref:Uncharacterized protein n=1 Tax=Dreissena polymorpha TaxID=45954 RepID=A0A9D4MKX0_DREPO|nr:hypothetical protein DPMN_001885 [Dreissena polymorpha]